jgi:hypothetical protein
LYGSSLRIKNEIIEYKGYEIELTLKDKLNNLFTFKIFNENDRLIEKLFGAKDKTTAKKIAKNYIDNLEGSKDNKIKININDVVKVELTEYGKEKYVDFYREHGLGVDEPETNFQCPLWNLMKIFGNCLEMGFNDIPFKNNKITITK